MGIQIRRFQPDDAPAIDRLNARLAAGGAADLVYKESATTPAESRGDPISHELYVAVDGDEVRGGVWLHEHQFAQRGELFRAGWLKYPVSESLINREFGGIPGAMLVSLTRRQPHIMALGMGGRATPIAQLLAALGWRIIDVPFYIAPVRLSRVIANLPQLRRPLLKRAAELATRTGLTAALGFPIEVFRKAVSSILLRRTHTEAVPEFGQWADEIWERARGDYGLIARRDAAMLNQFYPADFPQLTRLRVTRNGRDIGWVVVTLLEAASRPGSREFGDLRVGLIADGLGHPEDAPALVAAGCCFLIAAGADLLVSNQSHHRWRRALRHLGFVSRPTNFLFACSKRMSARLGPAPGIENLFLNRGDCDGPPR